MSTSYVVSDKSNGSIILSELDKIVRLLACMVESKNTEFLLANLNVRGHSYDLGVNGRIH